MGYVNFDLLSCGALSTLASPGPGAPGQVPFGLPSTGGFYLIYNENHTNRYVGKSGNLEDRFVGRMLTVNEFGLARADLGQIYAFWGVVDAFNTPVLAPPGFAAPGIQLTNGFRVARNAQGAAPLVPNNFIGTAAPDPNYGAPNVTTTIDGALVDLEALLIRFFRQIGVGGTMTNLQKMGLFQNPTGNELIVQVAWGACGNTPAAYYCITIPANGSF